MSSQIVKELNITTLVIHWNSWKFLYDLLKGEVNKLGFTVIQRQELSSCTKK